MYLRFHSFFNLYPIFIDRFIYYLSIYVSTYLFIDLDIYLSKHLFACFYFFLLWIGLTNFNYKFIIYILI